MQEPINRVIINHVIMII